MAIRYHPLVIEFDRLVEKSGKSFSQIEKESGVSRGCFFRWRTRNSPTVVSLEAALNVVGYTLTIVPLEGGPKRMPKSSKFTVDTIISQPMSTETYPENSHTDKEEIDNLFDHAPSNGFIESLHEWWMEKGFLTEEQFRRLEEVSSFGDSADKFNRFDRR